MKTYNEIYGKYREWKYDQPKEEFDTEKSRCINFAKWLVRNEHMVRVNYEALKKTK